MDLNSKLPLFLQDAASRRFVDGTFDCGLWLANWVMFALDIPDPIRDIRGSYSTIEERDRICGPLGTPRIIQRLARRAGLPATRDPLPGDIGLVRDRLGKGAMGSIKSNRGWVVLHPQGPRYCGIKLLTPEILPSMHLMMSWRV